MGFEPTTPTLSGRGPRTTEDSAKGNPYEGSNALAFGRPRSVNRQCPLLTQIATELSRTGRDGNG
jgi:hypothetical protein